MGSSGNSSTTSNFTPQSNSGYQLVVDVSSKHIAADTSLPGISSSKPVSVHNDVIDAKITTVDAFYTALDPVLSADPKYATGFVSSRSNFRAECNYDAIAPSPNELNVCHKPKSNPELFSFKFMDFSGHAMLDQWPQVFHQLSERAYEATTRQDGDQIPEPWICLITGLPLISDAFWFHLFSERERCLEIILCALSRIVLAVITKWPTRLTPTLFRKREYSKHLAWNPDGMVL